MNLNFRSAIIEEQANIQLVEPNQVKITEKETLIEDTPDSLLNAILEKDKELKRLLHEKEMLLSRLLNIPQEQINDIPGNVRLLNINLLIDCIPIDCINTNNKTHFINRGNYQCC